ncbi:MAG: hypothetical protein FJ264_16970 [Planctomycetes bacterium]|nr:hypothetical protein [Planctomycetota bacterium]
MSGKERHNSIKKYLEAKEFVEYCISNNVHASLDMLEAYEKAGLLIPFYRLVFPDEYIRALCEYDCKIIYTELDIPFDGSKWQEIDELSTAINLYSVELTSQFYSALKNGHPLDYAYQNQNLFLQKPNRENFKPWEKYIIIAGTLDGYPVKEEKAKHYYTPWQIFVLDELNFMHTIEENYATKLKKGWGIFKKELRPSKLGSFCEYFQTISNFRMMKSLICQDITYGLKSSILEGELYKQLRRRTVEQAINEYGKHSYSEWIKFVRKLVELYMAYNAREKIKLANELKRFLTNTINMLTGATKKPFEEISSAYDGKFKRFGDPGQEEGVVIYPGKLERIYPDEFKETKENAKRIFDFQIKQLNETLPNNLKIKNEIVDALVNNIIGNGHHLLLTHLNEIEELWLNHGPRWKSSIWAHLRSFAVSIESIAQEWYGQNTLGNVLEYAFKKEYSYLRDSIGERITDAKTSSEYRGNFAKILEHKKKYICGICGYHLVSAHLTRNYFSHKIKYEPDMLGSIFIEVYKDLVFTLISLFVKKISDDKCL